MIRKTLFELGHLIQYPKFVSTYKKLIDNQWKGYEEKKSLQEKQLHSMIEYAYTYVPYYHKLFRNLNLLPEDVRTVEDLEKLPILTKDIIKENWNDFKPHSLDSLSYNTQSTGGTTGTPFSYRLEKKDRFLGASITYRGWGYGGYHLGEKMIFLAGSSLGIDPTSTISKRLHEITRNIRKLSSFDMSEKELYRHANVLISFKPTYIRGYPSSIYFFAKWLQQHDIDVPPIKAVFTTAEKLYPYMRNTIEDVFCCDVFDNYGLNDGGVGAFECKEHSGLHIDTERSIMELADNDGSQINNGEGRILATSLHNHAMPFIRYDTGDDGHIIPDICGCGRGSLLLKEIVGRSVDVFITPEGKYVHGWFFLYIFWEYGEGIKEYQVIQKTISKIIIYLVLSDEFDESILEKIRQLIISKSNEWQVDFVFVDEIKRTPAGKYKFIISEVV